MNTPITDLVLAAPGESAVKLNETLAAIRAAKNAAVAEIVRDMTSITEENWSKKMINAFDGFEKELKAKTDAAYDAVATATHLKDILVEVAAARAGIKAAIKDRTAVIRDFKTRFGVAEPRIKVALVLDLTASAWKKMDGDLRKSDSIVAGKFAILNGPAAVKAVCDAIDTANGLNAATDAAMVGEEVENG